jgi:hypothetical protein
MIPEFGDGAFWFSRMFHFLLDQTGSLGYNCMVFKEASLGLDEMGGPPVSQMFNRDAGDKLHQLHCDILSFTRQSPLT